MCTRQNSLFLSFRTRVLALQKDFNIKTLFVPQFISLSLSLLSCSVATIISFYIVFLHHHHHHHQCFFAGFGDGFICAHREECEEKKECEEKECRSLSARCYYAFHSNKNTTTIRERKDDDDDDDSPKKRGTKTHREDEEDEEEDVLEQQRTKLHTPLTTNP